MYRAKWQIGLEQIRRARANGIRLAWMMFDEGYGGKGPFLRGLDELGQNYVGELPSNFTAWTQPPAVLYRQHASNQTGRTGKPPRLKVKNNPTIEVRNIAYYSPLFRREDWQTYHVKDGHKRPMVWHAKRIRVWLKDENGLPTAPHHLLVTCRLTRQRASQCRQCRRDTLHVVIRLGAHAFAHAPSTSSL